MKLNIYDPFKFIYNLYCIYICRLLHVTFSDCNSSYVGGVVYCAGSAIVTSVLFTNCGAMRSGGCFKHNSSVYSFLFFDYFFISFTFFFLYEYVFCFSCF
jgi:hypothetical protein